MKASAKERWGRRVEGVFAKDSAAACQRSVALVYYSIKWVRLKWWCSLYWHA